VTHNIFRDVFHAAGLPQAILDQSGTIIDANEALCNLLGYPDMCSLAFYKLIPEGTQYVVPDVTSAYLEHRELVREDGSKVWSNLYYASIQPEQGEKLILVQVLDLSAERALESDLQTTQNEIDRFAYIASHDLREPLSTLTGYATLIQRRCPLEGPGAAWMEEIVTGAKKLARKIDDLLEFSRTGRELKYSEFPLGAAIEEGKRAVAKRFFDTEAHLHIRGNLPMIHGDRSLIAQVFQNLFSNSLKYYKPEVVPEITISARSLNDGTCEITVQDNGLGFDSDIFGHRVFEVFQRLYTVDQYPGTGIGLALTKKIIERHGGSIYTSSKPNEGATFIFTLPEIPQQ